MLWSRDILSTISFLVKVALEGSFDNEKICLSNSILDMIDSLTRCNATVHYIIYTICVDRIILLFLYFSLCFK